MSQYDLHGIVKRYGGREVLSIPRLSVRAGRTLAVIGPNGAGKSTLLRLLNFLEAPDEGDLCFDGERIREGPPPLAIRRAITTVFQRPLLMNTTVWGNAAFGLRLRGPIQKAEVAKVLEQVGLTHLARARASTLSAGEAQRVALARALVLQPRVLLLDEPTAALDPPNVRLIEELLRALQAGPTTIVIVTHNLFQARRLADDALLLVDGVLVEAGPAIELFESPRDPRTAAFCQGTMVY